MNEEEFLQNFEDVEGLIRSLVYQFANGDPTLADDNYQNVMIMLWRKRNKFQPGTNFAGWSYRLAYNTLVNEWRKRKRYNEVREEVKHFAQKPEQIPQPDEILEAIEDRKHLKEIVDSVPQPYRDVLILCVLQEMSYKEAAEKLSVPVGTIMSRLHRARQSLQINPRTEA